MKTASAFTVVYWDLPAVEFFGNAGLSYAEVTQQEAAAIAVRAEFERFKSPLDHYEVDAITASRIYTSFQPGIAHGVR